MRIDLSGVCKTLILAFLTVLVTAILGEVLLRVKNSDQKNYTVEMWRYAKELKTISSDPELGHVHIPNSSARLQGVDFAINSHGMRGVEPNLGDSKKKVLLIGSSITLGWGVRESETLRGHLERLLGARYEVLNGGVGNYNASRSVALFRKKWRDLVKPDVVILHYFVNDAEYLPPSKDNFIIRNSQLGVILYYIVQGLMKGSIDMSMLVDHYREVYEPDSRGYLEMVSALDSLDEMAKADGFRVILAMVPDIHQLKDYPLGFIHRKMAELAARRGWQFVDFYADLAGYEGPELWTIPGDPHPNGMAHGIMARTLTSAIFSN